MQTQNNRLNSVCSMLLNYLGIPTFFSLFPLRLTPYFTFLFYFLVGALWLFSPGGHEGGHVQLQREGDIGCDLPPKFG